MRRPRRALTRATWEVRWEGTLDGGRIQRTCEREVRDRSTATSHTERFCWKGREGGAEAGRVDEAKNLLGQEEQQCEHTCTEILGRESNCEGETGGLLG